MKKKQIRKRNLPTKTSATQTKKTIDLKISNQLKTRLGLIVAAFAFILYSQSIKHDYTLDDHKVIDQNKITTTGIRGISTILKTDYWYGSGHNELRGPIYRPLPLIVFAVVWEISPNSPQVYHFINVLLYAITCLVLFLLLVELFKNQNFLIPFVCAILFAAHPIHTEVVNNIKSLDEILCFLFGIVSIKFLLKYSSTRSKSSFAAGALAFLLALLSKETGIAFLVIIPVTLFIFSENSKKPIVSVSVLLSAITAFWLVIRMMIFKDLSRNIVTETSALNNTLYAAPDLASRYATAFYILFRYIVLLIFPHPLTSDYNYAQIKIQTFSDYGALLGLLIYIALGAYAILNIKKRNTITFSILFYLLSLAPVSNIFFLGGSSMAERFLYMPSLGFCLALSYLLTKFIKSERECLGESSIFKFFATSFNLFVFVFGISILYSLKTFSRNKDWKDTLTVYSRDIQVSKNSATANELFGNSLILSTARSPNRQHQQDTFNLAKEHLKKALEIAPAFFDASSNLGYVYLVENKPDSAYLYLKQGLKHGPNDVQINYYYGCALFLKKNYDEAIKALQHTIDLNVRYEDAYLMLASSYLGKGDMHNALLWYSKLIEVNPNNPTAYYNAAGIVRATGDTAKANSYMNKAMSLGYQQK